ncbi:MAG: pantoate--beta-alanine ligase [Nitrospiraceae bacterium]|nr:pantoate--beta-alanine ligase [Nitrospiraceae bacterium]
MKHITAITEMQEFCRSLRREGKTIGFVPTMGFLHDGHLSLMRTARAENDVAVASIFVNPTQFGPNEDLDRYPRDAEGDAMKCAAAGVDVLFLPATAEMYAGAPAVFVTVEKLSEVLEGAIRPGHFRGVATVVTKLFNIVQPNRAYFGQKDYQQCAVIRRMAAGLNMGVDIRALPTMRESDGLAMSSRNVYLDPEQRRKATCLYRALSAAAELVRAGVHEPEKVRQKMRAVLLAEKGVEIDYAEIVDPDTLVPLDRMQDRMVLLVATRVGSTRLIDNLLVL